MTDWFALTVSPLELFVRGSMMYLGLVLIVRFVLRRNIGSMSTADVLFIVLIADASQNGMAGEYKSITDGAVLIATLVAWNLALDFLAFRSSAIRRLIEAPPLPLIQDGRWLRQNLKKEWITPEEVTGKLREMGIDDIALVKTACLESDGELGVIRRKAESEVQARKSRRTGTA